MLTLNEDQKVEAIRSLVVNCDGWDEEDIDLLVNFDDEKLMQHVVNCAELIENMEEDDGIPASMDTGGPGEKSSAATTEGWDEEITDKGDQGDNLAATEQDKNKDQPKRCHDEEGNEIKCPENESTAQGENVQNERQWLSSAPPRIREVVINALRFEQGQKDQLIETITANQSNRFTDEYLHSLSTRELEGIAALATQPVVNRAGKIVQDYSGAAGGPVLNETVDRNDVLTIPTIDYSRS